MERVDETTKLMAAVYEPYVGPRTFQKGQGRIFRGRDKEARDLVALVSSQRAVLFYAQSGAGKSSLINARLVPELEMRGFEVLPIGRVGGESNPIDPVDNIFVYNLLLTQDKGKKIRSEEANRHLHRRFTTMQLVEFMNYLILDDGVFLFNDAYQYPAEYRPKPRVLIIDQFEEILTSHLNHQNIRRQRAQFFEQIHAAMTRDPWLWVVFSLRSDYVAGLDPYTHLVPGNLRERYYMERMDAEGALKAIMEPVEIFKWEYEREAAEELCRNLLLVQGSHLSAAQGERVMGEYVEPVQLQVVCYQLWRNLNKNRDEKLITLADLENQARLAGGHSVAEFVDSALSEFYNRAVREVAESEPGRTEADIRRWFGEELITPANTRNLIFDDTVKVGSLDKDLVDKLDVKYRLVRPEVRGLSNWYELTHDRFIQPIQHANQKWLEDKPPIYHAAREWHRGGRKDYFLFTGERLTQTLATVENGSLNFSDPLINEFLDACRRAESHREDENRVRANFDRLISLGAVLSGAALFGYFPVILLTLMTLLMSLVALAEPEVDPVDSAEIGSLLLAMVLTFLILTFVFTGLGAGIGWFLKRNGYDWLRTHSNRKKQLQIFQDKLERTRVSFVPDG